VIVVLGVLFGDVVARRGLERGAVLEWGSWFGSFALPLQRLGYDVTAGDCYASWGAAFDAHTQLLARDGVRVVATERGTETDALDRLGRFDVVFAGAVIEHLPHTPRLLLEALRARVRPGGLLVVDTPNLTRYWNRRLMEEGSSVFQAIDEQFGCEPPWEGHHREYTAQELVWMFQRLGCHDVEAEFLDYNLLQFRELSDEHLACLATLLSDPSQADTVLVSGVVNDASRNDQGVVNRWRRGRARVR
jgi:SAM-dependent methyltransferase